MNQIDVLLQITPLVEAHVAALVLATEGFLLGVDAKVRVELADAAENFVADLLALRHVTA